jgi:phage-related protein
VIHSFVAADVLEIDCGTEKITINDSLAMTDLDVNTDFFEIMKGDNEFTVTPDNVATVELAYKPRWV